MITERKSFPAFVLLLISSTYLPLIYLLGRIMQFHKLKLLSTIGPLLSKETILSKIINFIDAFQISFFQGFDDSKKKHINTIAKLDSSKTIMMLLKGNYIRSKNTYDFTVKKGQDILVDFSDYPEDKKGFLFLDYPLIDKLSEGSIISFEENNVELQINAKEGPTVICKVKNGGTIKPESVVKLNRLEEENNYLSQKDKKDIIRAMQNGMNILVMPYITDIKEIQEVKNYVFQQVGKDVKVIVTLDSDESVKMLDEILLHCDGIRVENKQIETLLKHNRKSKKDFIHMINTYGKPLVISYDYAEVEHKKNYLEDLKEYIEYGCDTFMLANEDGAKKDPIDIIMDLHATLEQHQKLVKTEYELEECIVKPGLEITDYLIYQTYKISKEFGIKAIVCYTDTGHNAAKLSALKPVVPIIVFTKSDVTYKYLNVLRSVKGYKIASTFDHHNIKQIGKEMIRIIFKGNILLDDKILIIQANDSLQRTHLTNALEIYKFKDI